MRRTNLSFFLRMQLASSHSSRFFLHRLSPRMKNHHREWNADEHGSFSGQGGKPQSLQMM